MWSKRLSSLAFSAKFPKQHNREFFEPNREFLARNREFTNLLSLLPGTRTRRGEGPAQGHRRRSRSARGRSLQRWGRAHRRANSVAMPRLAVRHESWPLRGSFTISRGTMTTAEGSCPPMARAPLIPPREWHATFACQEAGIVNSLLRAKNSLFGSAAVRRPGR